MANMLTDTNRVFESVPLLREVVKTNPNHALAHWELGYAYRFTGMLNESIAECERARTLDPQVNYTLEYWQLFQATYDGLLAFTNLALSNHVFQSSEICCALITADHLARSASMNCMTAAALRGRNTV